MKMRKRKNLILMFLDMNKKIKHNDLTHYFLRPHSQLPQAYLASCEKFFKWLEDSKRNGFKAPSVKQDLTSSKPHGTNRIIKENKK